MLVHSNKSSFFTSRFTNSSTIFVIVVTMYFTDKSSTIVTLSMIKRKKGLLSWHLFYLLDVVIIHTHYQHLFYYEEAPSPAILDLFPINSNYVYSKKISKTTYKVLNIVK